MPSYKNFLKKNESRVWNSLKSAAPKNSLYFPTPEMFENYPDPFSRDYFRACNKLTFTFLMEIPRNSLQMKKVSFTRSVKCKSYFVTAP